MGSNNAQSAVALRSTFIMACRALICASAFLLTIPAMAMADSARFNIAAQPLPQALKAFADQAHMQVLYQYDAVSRVSGNAVNGKLDKHAALEELLKNTGLEAIYSSGSAVTIRPIHVRTQSSSEVGQVAAPGSGASQQAASSSEAGSEEDKNSLWSRFRVAQADQGSSGAAENKTRRDETSERKRETLQEIVVTAQKREERLQDVPVPVTAISGEILATSGQVRLEDYYSSIPAFSVSPAGYPGNPQMLVIRGLSSGAYTNSTVGVTVDDVPFGGTTSVAANVIPDFDPSDLARVEVLRGPQGTLYGASTMGGLLKFVTVDPSTDNFTGRVQADGNGVHNGAEAGYGLRGAVNVPLGDTFAIRASAFTRQDPGYIDNPILQIDGVNKQLVSGGRVSGLWRPSNTFSLKLSALYQDTKADGLNEVDVPTAGFPETTGLGDLQQNYVRGCCAYDKTLQVYSAILTAKLGNVDLTSVSGYNISKYSTRLDFSYAFDPFAQFLFPGTTGVKELSYGSTEKFTQEIRASVPIGQSLEWLVGGFYTHENLPVGQNISAVNRVTGAILGNVAVDSFGGKYTEYAGFTDLTVHFTDRFDVQFGGRESHIEQISEPVIQQGPLFGAPPGTTITLPAIKSTPDAFTYLVTPQFKFSSDLMVYARIASGYRPGSSNSYDVDPLVPRASTPDKTQNYELGTKGDIVDHLLSFDASLYYIDWKNLQLVLGDSNPGYNVFVYNANGARAKSQGVELSVQSTPVTGLSIAGWVAYDDAVLTEAMPATSTVYGPAGSRLPYGARFSGNVSVNQAFPLFGRVSGIAGAQLSYIGDRAGTFAPISVPRQIYPSYSKVDAHAGLNYGPWAANLYANNIADRRGVLGGGGGTVPGFAYYYIQPRTIGLSLTVTF